MQRIVGFGDGRMGPVSLIGPVLRYQGNPVLTARQVNDVWTEPHLQVVTVHNAGVAVVGSETVMVFRSHLRCGISVLGLARSDNGVTGWRVEPRPFLKPATAEDPLAPGLDPAEIAEMEAGGVEDARINPIDGTFAITYSAYGYTEDFRTGPWDVVDEPVMRANGSPSAFADKIGPCAPPVKTAHGWLNLFHGVRTTMDGNPYVLGIALHDLQTASTVRMSSIPVLFPSRADCRIGEADYVHVPNVLFSCGMLRRPDGTLLIYYGGNDTVMNVAVSHEDVLAEMCRRYGQDPRTGRLLYPI